MSERLVYGKNPPISLVEKLNFSEKAPYIIRHKKLLSEDNTILHYSNAIEIDICHDAIGFASIGYYSHNISGNQIIVIPPNLVHSVHFSQSPGDVYVLHISLPHLQRYINLEAMLAEHGLKLSNLAYSTVEFEPVYQSVVNMVEHDDNIFFRLAEMLRIFQTVTAHLTPADFIISTESFRSNALMIKLIEWTEQNYNKEIHLEDAAHVIGFSKNYFCCWFKKLTGITYNNYLNDVKIAQACVILQNTQSVSHTCSECGFKDISYFIQLFKKKTHLTPLQYLKCFPAI